MIDLISIRLPKSNANTTLKRYIIINKHNKVIKPRSALTVYYSSAWY